MNLAGLQKAVIKLGISTDSLSLNKADKTILNDSSLSANSVYSSEKIQSLLDDKVDLAGDTLDDGANIALGTTTGTKIGTATSQKLGLWNVTPIVQPTTAVTEATFLQNSGDAVNDNTTFDGYTIAQIVKALRNIGALQ